MCLLNKCVASPSVGKRGHISICPKGRAGKAKAGVGRVSVMQQGLTLVAPTGLNTWQHQAILLTVKSFSLARKSYRPPHLLGHKPKVALWRAIKTYYFCETLPGPCPPSH